MGVAKKMKKKFKKKLKAFRKKKNKIRRKADRLERELIAESKSIPIHGHESLADLISPLQTKRKRIKKLRKKQNKWRRKADNLYRKDLDEKTFLSPPIWMQAHYKDLINKESETK